MKHITNEQILKLAIEKAVKNGWGFQGEWDVAKQYINFTQQIIDKNYMKIIFRLDFAKAFWGEKWGKRFVPIYLIGDGGKIKLKRWQYELQEMVLKSNPIKYLEKFI